MKVLIATLLFVGFCLCHENHGHAHDNHDHAHGDTLEDVKFRYSKQANADNSEDGPDFPPVHEHVHHEHSHEDPHHDHEHLEHSHHGHSHEDPKHKYSKDANVQHAKTHENNHEGDTQSHGEHDHSHGDHDHSHRDHDHSHGDHEHSHGDHDHSHEDHGHSHGDHDDSHKGHGHSHKDHAHSHGNHDHSHKDHKQYTPPTKEPVFWLEPLLAAAIISAAPFLILFIVPLSSNSPENRPFLKILLAFASGGLLGDAFLHLIPHAISPHAHDEQHSHSHSHSHSHDHHSDNLGDSHDHTGDMIVGLWVLAGIIVFLVVEKLVRHIKGGHGHSHSHGEPKKEESKKDDTNVKGEKKSEKKAAKPAKKEKTEDEVKVSAYLNLAADCTHNFTDGLAIGASFLVSRNVGMITTLTIFLHEIPHEIGDFAILIQSGCTKRKAMMLQLVTAVGAFAGCICGLLAEGLGTAASSWILPFTAGGFIYIATVSVIPELLEESKLVQSIKEIFALLVGVFLMVLIALTE